MKKPKQVKLIASLNTGIFSAKIMFIHAFTPDEVLKFFKKSKPSDGWQRAYESTKHLHPSWYAAKREVENKDYFFLVIPDFFNSSDWDYCKLAHEVLHLCQFILPDILDRDREFECEAYLHTHIMQQVLKELRGNKK